MARPRKNSPPDRFTSSEMALAAGITTRNFGVLIENRLAPRSVHESEGKSGSRSFDQSALKSGALTGAIHKAGVELFLAARLGLAVNAELSSRYPQMPANMQTFLMPPLNIRSPQFPWPEEPGDPVLPSDAEEEFWIHYYLRTRTSIYVPGQALRGDFLIEVIDRQYIFLDGLGALKVRAADGSMQNGEPFGRISGWDRGGDQAVLITAYEELPGVDSTSPRYTSAVAQFEREFYSARENATGYMRLNLSLAVRNAFDAIHDHRMESGANYDWKSLTPKTHTQQAGEDGWPIPLKKEAVDSS